jgi:hypothetical protein
MKRFHSPRFAVASLLGSLLSVGGCAGDAAPEASGPTGPAGNAALDPAVSSLEVDVSATARSYVSLTNGSVGSDPTASWDLAFQGYEIFTNGGVSGSGQAWAFGPFEAETFDATSVPVAPITTPDKAAGAFLDWYFYEGAPAHVLWSRYHTLGVRDGARTWKVQILTYYGERDGAPVSGLYRLRYAEVTEGAPGETVEVDGLDASAGGVSGGDDAPSGCLDLATGARPALSPSAALRDASWHLCFRRQTITVNGGVSGPRGVTAVDLQSSSTETETLAEMKARTSDTTLARFEGITAAAFDGASFAPDRIVSGFGSEWAALQSVPPAPVPATWVVHSADGQSTFLLRFSSFTGGSPESPGRVVLQTKVFTP